MKKQTPILFLVILLMGGVGCDKKEKTDSIKFTGSFVDTKGDTIREGKIQVYLNNGKDEPKLVEFDIKDGSISDELPKAAWYVVNVKVKGYGLVSKVFPGTVPANQTYELKKATVVPFNITVGGLLVDTQNNCSGSFSRRADWSVSPKASLPTRVNSQGEISGYGMSEALQLAYDFHAKATPCNNGIQVTIPANSITGPGSPASISASMSVVDLFSPDGMPGDGSSEGGLMESFGAFSIELYDDKGNNFNLNEKEGKEAEVVFPANVVIRDPKGLPESIPLLYYDEKKGKWRKEGSATLDIQRMAYVAKVKHFSAINLDLEKNNPACLRIRDVEGTSETPPNEAPYDVEVTIPASVSSASPRVSRRTINPADLCTNAGFERQFALTRLPEATDVSIVFFRTPGPIPVATYVTTTGTAHPAELSDPNRPDCTEMSTLCGTKIISLDADNGTGGEEILLAGCKLMPSGNVVVSVAINNASGAGLGTAFKFTRLDGDTEVCTNNVPIPATPVFQHNSGTFTVYRYEIPSGSICPGSPDVYKISMLNGSAPISNEFQVVLCQ